MLVALELHVFADLPWPSRSAGVLDDPSNVVFQGIDARLIAEDIDTSPIYTNSEDFSQYDIKFLQYNIRTLLKTGYRKTLYTLASSYHYSIICLQETRTKGSGISKIGEFFVCKAPALNGQYGCEIWIHCKLCFGKFNSKKVCVSRNDISIIYEHSRLLAVSIHSGPFKILVESAHAPYGHEEDTTKWWDMYDLYALSCHSKYCCIIGGADFNASFNKHLCDDILIGSLASHFNHSSNQHIVSKSVRAHHLLLANTFSKHASPNFASNPYTFITPNGFYLKSIDYIYYIGDVFIKPRSIDRDLLLSIGSEGDHFPISCAFSIPPISGKSDNYKRRALPFNSKLMGSPCCDEVFFANFKKSCPSIPPLLEPSSHYHVVVKAFVDAAKIAYPNKGASKNSKYMQRDVCLHPDTRKAILRKSNLFKAMGRFHCWMVQATLFAVFGIWSHKRSPRNYSIVFAFGSIRTLKLWSSARNEYVTVCIHVDSLCQLEDLVYFANKDAVLDDTLASNNMPAIHQALKPFSNKAFKSTSTTKVINNEGFPSKSTAESKCVFRELFKSQQDGIEMSFADLLALDRNHLATYSPPSCDFGFFIDSIPLPSHLMHQFALTNAFKGFGEDLVPGIFLKLFPKFCTAIFYPIFIKSFNFLAPPIQWKGGMLQELFKNKGSSSDKSNYRDIMLGSIPGKKCFSTLRKCLIPFASSIVGLSQFGSGFNGGETAFAHLYLRLIFDYAKKIQTSCCVLFLDVSSAFASLLRRIIFAQSSSDESWLHQLKSAGYSEEDINTHLEHYYTM